MILLLPLQAAVGPVAGAVLEVSASQVPGIDTIESLTAMLDVTSAAAGVGDTLNLRLQGGYDLPDGSAPLWDDFLSFTQVLGNGGNVKVVGAWRRDVAPESEMHLQADGALAAGVLQGPQPGRWRWKWTVAGGTALFSFQVRAGFVKRRVA